MGEMGSLDEALSAMLSTDHGYTPTLASVLPSSTSASTGGLADDFFASHYSSLQQSGGLQQQSSLQGSLQGGVHGSMQGSFTAKAKASSNFHSAGGLQGNRPSAPSYRNAAEVWPLGRNQKWVLDGKNEALEVNTFRPPSLDLAAPPNVTLNPPAAGGLQRYHSAPSTFLQSLADFNEDALTQVAEDGDLLDSFFADTTSNHNNLAPINERGAQPMDTTGPSVVDAASSSSLNDYEQFLATSDFRSSLSPSTHNLPELRSLPGHGGYSTPDALGVRSRPSRINLHRQSSTPADFLAAVQDTLEPDSPVFRMPSFLTSPDGGSNSNMSGVTSEADSAGKLGNRLQGGEMGTEPPGWLGNSALRVRGGDPSSPQSKLGLIRHSSLPARSRPFSPTTEMEELADLAGGTVPCKTRANRGFATHPRSIAERVRRTKISERMKKLQDLVPNMDRQTNTADMLDEAVDYVKHLQAQVQELSNTVVQLKERLGHGN